MGFTSARRMRNSDYDSLVYNPTPPSHTLIFTINVIHTSSQFQGFDHGVPTAQRNGQQRK